MANQLWMVNDEAFDKYTEIVKNLLINKLHSLSTGSFGPIARLIVSKLALKYRFVWLSFEGNQEDWTMDDNGRYNNSEHYLKCTKEVERIITRRLQASARSNTALNNTVKEILTTLTELEVVPSE